MSPADVVSLSDEALLDLARQAATAAYSPYSRAQVGCALIAADGRLFTGCNVENASYGLTMCAERVAIGSAVAALGPRMKWTRIGVVALGLEFPPCGACRQVLAEFAAAEARVVYVFGGLPRSQLLSELLPAGFSGASLPR